jgi:hypothetical protein
MDDEVFSRAKPSSPKVTVEFLTQLLPSREVPGSNLGPETGYPDAGFSCFSLVTPEM